jgi:hypothetical protein
VPEVGNKGDDAHLGTAFSTAQGIHFEDTVDEPRPGRGWFAADRAFPDVGNDKFGFLDFAPHGCCLRVSYILWIAFDIIRFLQVQPICLDGGTLCPVSSTMW